MSEKKYLIKKCTLMPNDDEMSSLKEPYDIVKGISSIDYYESVEDTTISMKITFIDVDQVIGRKGITGGEYVDVIVLDGEEDKFEISSKEHKLVLNSVRNMVTESNKQVATLEFVSVEALINETARVNKKFTGNVTQTVKELLKDNGANGYQGIRTKKNLDSDDATNSYSFVGNLRRPFDTIQWLCSKGQSSKKNFGFLFYETIDGYHFRSIESLLKQEAVPYQQADRPIEGNKIIQNRLNQSNDIGENLRLGMYANRTLYIDIEKHTLKEVDFNITELDTKKNLKFLKDIEKHPSRLMLKVSDVGVSQKGSEKKDTKPNSELDVYKNKSYTRTSLLFSQTLQISVPLNTTLRAGIKVDVKFPLKNEEGEGSTDEYGSDKTNDPSGEYLISELRHLIGGGSGETQLTLIRDAFTA